MASVAADSRDRSIASGALLCIRYAISNASTRVAISGSATVSSRIRFMRFTVSMVSRCSASSTPGGLDRYNTGSLPLRNCTPEYTVGRKPEPQFEAPPLGPFDPVLNTTKPGRSRDSVPSPYKVHAPKLGRPKIWDPVLIRIWPGA